MFVTNLQISCSFEEKDTVSKILNTQYTDELHYCCMEEKSYTCVRYCETFLCTNSCGLSVWTMKLQQSNPKFRVTPSLTFYSSPSCNVCPSI
jgi:exonuclease III